MRKQSADQLHSNHAAEQCLCFRCIDIHVVQSLYILNPKFLGHMSLVVRKPDFCICENKDADQLRGNHEADQRLCFRFMDTTIPLLSKFEISSLYPSSGSLHPGLCQTWSETPKTGFLTTRLKCSGCKACLFYTVFLTLQFHLLLDLLQTKAFKHNPVMFVSI